MTREEILTAIRPYFDIDELVCNHTVAKWGDKSWQFLDTDFLHCLLVIRRDIVKRAMWCNGSQKKQRGLRCNRCDMVRSKSSVYLSSHVLGKAGGIVQLLAGARINYFIVIPMVSSPHNYSPALLFWKSAGISGTGGQISHTRFEYIIA